MTRRRSGRGVRTSGGEEMKNTSRAGVSNFGSGPVES